MQGVYQPRDLDTSSWDSWQSALVKEILAHEPGQNLVLIPRDGTFPPPPPPRKPPKFSQRLRSRNREMMTAPVIQAMRDDNSLLLDLTGPASMGGDYPWSDDQVEALYDLGWPRPVNEGVVVFTMYLPHSPLPPRPYLPDPTGSPSTPARSSPRRCATSCGRARPPTSTPRRASRASTTDGPSAQPTSTSRAEWSVSPASRGPWSRSQATTRRTTSAVTNAWS